MKLLILVGVLIIVGTFAVVLLVRGAMSRQEIVQRGYDWASGRHSGGVTLREIAGARDTISNSPYGRCIDRGITEYLEEHGYFDGGGTLA